MKKQKFRNDQGAALMLSLIFMMAMAIIVAAMANRNLNQTRQVVLYTDFNDALAGVEAALALARAELKGGAGTNFSDLDGMIGVKAGQKFEHVPSFDPEKAAPIELASMPNVEYFAYTIPWATDGKDNNGDENTDEEAEEDYFTVYALARATGGGAERTVEVVMKSSNVNIWTNAIFAGEGKARGLINGNVEIHGSVHLLGTGLNPGDEAVSAIELSGTCLIHNNYNTSGSNAPTSDQWGRIPAPPTTSVDGELVSTLNAKLRVKKGLVGLSGNSEIGEVNVAGNPDKEMMDGIFVNDGWTGNALDADGNPVNTYSDNGSANGYDLGGAIPMPIYADDGGRDHLAYFLEEDGVGEGFHVPYVGDLTIANDGTSFYWNSTTGDMFEAVDPVTTGPPDSHHDGIPLPNKGTLSNTDHYIYFDADAGELTVNGRVAVDGNILFTDDGGGSNEILYTGKGSILAYDADASGDGGDVDIDISLLTMNADGTTELSFPDNLLGVMAEDQMNIADSAQMTIMGGFYAQGEVMVNQQTNIFGTIVGNDFNMGGQLPGIYQVPGLEDAWQADVRMIGANPVRFIAPVSWRELGVG